MTIIDQLDKMDELLSTPEKWTQNAMARDIFGWTVSCISANACKWCLLGANLNVLGDRYLWSQNNNLRSTLESAIFQYKGSELPIETFNDLCSTTFEDIKAVIKIAKGMPPCPTV